jgi:thioredoxin 2
MDAPPAGRPVTLPCPSCGRLNRIDLARHASGPKCSACGTVFRLDAPLSLGLAQLERVVRDASVPVLADFYADWCAPCRAMAPTLDALARDRAGSALVVKVDSDRHPDAAVRYQVRGIPTLVAFRHGREVAREVGAVPRPALESLLQRAAAA